MLYVMTPSKVSPTDPELPTGEVEYLNEGMDKLYAALDEQACPHWICGLRSRRIPAGTMH